MLLLVLCWCFMHGGLIILVDSLSVSLGMGMSITLQAGVKVLGWLCVGSSVVRAPAATLPAGGPSFNSWQLPWIFLLQLAYYC